MGAVYKSRDQELDRVVALKVIRPEFANNPEIVRMFKQELILARQVTHRNVIRIFDLGLADGLRFITMQYVEGEDLKEYVMERAGSRRKIPPQSDAGLPGAGSRAHKEKVVHRDLKPQNIMIDKQNRALVMDFGLAYSTETAGPERKTAGTPAYMSPEQAQRQELDARSDLFSAVSSFSNC